MMLLYCTYDCYNISVIHKMPLQRRYELNIKYELGSVRQYQNGTRFPILDAIERQQRLFDLNGYSAVRLDI
jgi:hypothetical protein